MLSHSAAFLVTFLIGVLPSPVGASPDEACKAALTTTISLVKCGFVRERSGAQYYTLEFEAKVIDAAKVLANTEVEAQQRMEMLSVPVVLMLTEEEEYKFASVRFVRDQKPVAELTRSEYTECVRTYGDPAELTNQRDETLRRAVFGCIYQKVFRDDSHQ